MRTAISVIFLLAFSLPLAMPSSAADGRGGYMPRHGRQIRGDGRSVQPTPPPSFRGGDIRHFPDHDMGVWRGGHWVQGAHGGRRGWWWVAGGVWFLYPEPIYPYPDPYLPPLIEAPLAPGYWYYCDDPPGYYPYVAECRMPWHTVAPGEAPPE